MSHPARTFGIADILAPAGGPARVHDAPATSFGIGQILAPAGPARDFAIAIDGAVIARTANV